MKDFLKVIELTPKLMASLLPAPQARLEVRGAAALAPRSFSGDSRRTRRGGGVPVAVTTTQRQGPGTSHGLLEAGLGGRSREEPPGGELGGGGQRRARRGRPGVTLLHPAGTRGRRPCDSVYTSPENGPHYRR